MAATSKRTKVILVISDIDKAVGFEWITKNLDRSKIELCFVLLNSKPSYLAKFLENEGVTCYELSLRGKKDLPFLLVRLMRIFGKERPDVVHTHLYAANVVGQTAARILNIKRRIYTRHSSNENRLYYNKQRVDHFVNYLVTDIVAISDNVKEVLIREEGVDGNKITLIHHGFDLKQFEEVSSEDISRLASKYNPSGKGPVIGVIARYSHWKGIQYVIPAFKELLADFPDALLLLANAKRGDFKHEIESMLTELPEGSFREIEFEHNLFALYRLFDVYVHVPINRELEAFGQTYVEALASGVPSVFTNSGVAPEFIRHESNALVVDYQNSEQVYEAMKRLLGNAELRSKLSRNGRLDVDPMFSLKMMIGRLEELYLK